MDMMAWNDLDLDVENDDMSLEKLYCLTSFILEKFQPVWYEAKEEIALDGKRVWFHGFETMITGQLWNVDISPQPASQNIDLTLSNNNANISNIQLDVSQKQAQTRIDEIQDISILRLQSYNASHTQHAYDITGLPKGTKPKDLYQKYEQIATEFFKSKIDGIDIDGFIDKDGALHKFDRKTGIYGRLFPNNKFGSIYKLDGDIEERWEKYKKRFRKEE